MTAIPNIWHLRRVAEAAAKTCDICYKPTSSVLITPDNKDFFYVCPGHLKDRGFASPVVDGAEVAARMRKEEMEREIEKVKAEYEEKMKKKKNKDKNDTDQKKGKEKDTDGDEVMKAEKEKNDKINAITNKNVTLANQDIPRIYTLQKIFYQKRLDRIRNAETTKRNVERLKNPTTFPSVPTKDLG